MESAIGFFGIFGVLFSLLPLILAVILLRWVFLIKRNSDEQVKQNREIISLLKKREDVER